MGKRLPRSVQELADVIGRDAALFLIGHLPRAYSKCHPSGQVVLYVPRTLKVDHHLVALLGWNTAMRLVRAFGGEMLQPAHCADLYRDFRDRSIVRLLNEGHRVSVLAEWFGVCERHIQNLQREFAQVAAMKPIAETCAA